MTCNCRSCIVQRGDKVHGMPRLNAEMIVCPHCGDKRCVHAEDHDAPCAKVDIYAHNAWVERRQDEQILVWPKLSKPARVGNGTFGVGVSARLVVEAAQRQHEYHADDAARTPEQAREHERKRREAWDMFNGGPP